MSNQVSSVDEGVTGNKEGFLVSELSSDDILVSNVEEMRQLGLPVISYNDMQKWKSTNESIVQLMSALRTTMKSDMHKGDVVNMTNTRAALVTIDELLHKETLIIESVTRKQQGRMTPEQYRLMNEWIEITSFVTVLHIFLQKKDVSELLSSFYKNNILLPDPKITLDSVIDAYTQNKSNGDGDEELGGWLIELPKLKFNSFSGRTDLINDLKLTIDLHELSKSRTIILMTGPPGTGKSDLAKACLNRFAADYNYELGVAELQSPTIGVTEKKLKYLFDRMYTKRNEKFAIFIDEIDEIFDKRKPEHLQSVAIVIQTALEGSARGHFGNNVLIVCATNYKTNLSSPLLDRIPQTYFVDVPAPEERENFFLQRTGIQDFYHEADALRKNNHAGAVANLLIIFNSNNRITEPTNNSENFNIAYHSFLKHFNQKCPVTTTFRNLSSIIETARKKMFKRLSNIDYGREDYEEEDNGDDEGVSWAKKSRINNVNGKSITFCTFLARRYRKLVIMEHHFIDSITAHNPVKCTTIDNLTMFIEATYAAEISDQQAVNVNTMNIYIFTTTLPIVTQYINGPNYKDYVKNIYYHPTEVDFQNVEKTVAFMTKQVYLNFVEMNGTVEQATKIKEMPDSNFIFN